MLWHALLIIGSATLIASGFWPLRRLSMWPRFLVLLLLSVAVLLLPFAFPGAHVGWRCLLALACGFVCCKLIDTHRQAAAWAGGRFRDWLCFLFHPLLLSFRRCDQLPAPERRAVARRLGRAVVEVGVGGTCLAWLWQHGGQLPGFWAEHTAKLLATYLCIWDGMFVLLQAAWRLLGGRCMDLSQHPILARTPADFWRRYNRFVGEFLHTNFFTPVDGRRHPVRGILTVFVVSGLMHEYFAWVTLGRPLGYPLLFFVIQGVGVACTYRWRPRGARRVLGMILTFVFNWLTSILVFICFARVLGHWYTHWPF